MSTIKRFEDLEAWQLSRQICNKIHVLASMGELNRDFGLKDQIRRSSGSVMDNIAEGFGRDGNKEFRQFLSFSKGSICEVKSQLYWALDNNYIDQQTFDELYAELNNIEGKLVNLMRYLSTTTHRGNKYK